MNYLTVCCSAFVLVNVISAVDSDFQI